MKKSYFTAVVSVLSSWVSVASWSLFDDGIDIPLMFKAPLFYLFAGGMVFIGVVLSSSVVKSANLLKKQNKPYKFLKIVGSFSFLINLMVAMLTVMVLVIALGG